MEKVKDKKYWRKVAKTYAVLTVVAFVIILILAGVITDAGNNYSNGIPWLWLLVAAPFLLGARALIKSFWAE